MCGTRPEKKVKEKALEQDKLLNQIINMVDEQENRNRRGNIRIRGLSENVSPRDMIMVLQKIFQEMAQDLDVKDLTIDRAHREL